MFSLIFEFNFSRKNDNCATTSIERNSIRSNACNKGANWVEMNLFLLKDENRFHIVHKASAVFLYPMPMTYLNMFSFVGVYLRLVYSMANICDTYSDARPSIQNLFQEGLHRTDSTMLSKAQYCHTLLLHHIE